MTKGRFIAVVGPSGVGKDSVMAGIHKAMPDIHVVRRVITRSPELGGEVFEPVSEPEFHDLAKQGAFALHWGAHGLFYGIPTPVHDHLNNGTDCLANLSRKALNEAAQVFPTLLILNITAQPETLAKRLNERGRETAEQIRKRLAEADKPLPEHLPVFNLSNDGPLADTVTRATQIIRSAEFREHPEVLS